MKRRFISMALCLLMLITAVLTASCGNNEDVNVGTEKIESAMTLTIYGVKEKGTTDEAVAAVEEAMSKITEAQFNTRIKLMLYTAAEYDKVLEEKMDGIQAQLDAEAAEAEAKKAAEKEAKKSGASTDTTEAATSEESTEVVDETILNEYGLAETLYPDVEETQLDIFLMTDQAMFNKYSEKGVLSALDESLSSSSKLLKSYINPSILGAGKVGKTTYAILNNQPIGEYTFMLLNKELMDKYYYDADDFTAFTDALGFMLEVGANDGAYKPFMGDISPVNINYFTADGSKSVVGNMPLASAKAGVSAPPKALFSIKSWTTYIAAVKQLEEKGYIGAAEIKPGDKFGVGIIKGTYNDVEAFGDDYYVNVLQNPQGTAENIYNGMFAVSKYSKSLARSMEIITYLNTRGDLRNLFAYGIRGVNYDLDKTGVVKKLNDEYNMKLEYTGNLFVAYPPEGSTPDVWEDAKKQNLDMVLSPYFGFTIDEAQLDPALVRAVKAFSDTFYSELEARPAEGIEDWLLEYWDTADLDPSIQEWISVEDADAEDEYVPMGKIYDSWFKAAYPAS